MLEIAKSARDMISGMQPELQTGTFVFTSTNDPTLAARLAREAISVFQEKEGTSLLIPIELAHENGLNTAQSMRCITLNVYSSLEGVGLTAAVATALAENSIPCNMVAAFHHDHVFVPADMAKTAMTVLASLQNQAAENN